MRFTVHLKKKQVLCTDCGFFCWQIQEVSRGGPARFGEIHRRYRRLFQAGKIGSIGSHPDPENDEHGILCLRNQWYLTPHLKGSTEYIAAGDVRKLRQCLYYISYQPGFGPEEHKELAREKSTTRLIIRTTLIAAIIGAAAAIVSQFLYINFGPK